MSEPPSETRSWWTTLPGVLTALAALLTAVAGLVAALSQSGLFPERAKRAEDRPPVSASTAALPSPAVAESSTSRLVAQQPAASSATSGPQPLQSAAPTLSARDAGGPPPLVIGETLQLASFTINVLSVKVTSTDDATRISISFRATTPPDEGVAFSPADSVRLIVSGVPRAPKSSSSPIYLARDSAEDLAAAFDVRGSADDLVLRFSDRKGSVSRRLPPGGGVR